MGIYRTVFEINGDFGGKYADFSLPFIHNAPTKGVTLGIFLTAFGLK